MTKIYQLQWQNSNDRQTIILLSLFPGQIKLWSFSFTQESWQNHTNQSYWQTWQTPFSWQGKQSAGPRGVEWSRAESTAAREGERERERERKRESESERAREREVSWLTGCQARRLRNRRCCAVESPTFLGIQTDCTCKVAPWLTRYKTIQSTTPFSTNHKQSSKHN